MVNGSVLVELSTLEEVISPAPSRRHHISSLESSIIGLVDRQEDWHPRAGYTLPAPYWFLSIKTRLVFYFSIIFSSDITPRVTHVVLESCHSRYIALRYGHYEALNTFFGRTYFVHL
jgi:hypothetical protein